MTNKEKLLAVITRRNNAWNQYHQRGKGLTGPLVDEYHEANQAFQKLIFKNATELDRIEGGRLMVPKRRRVLRVPAMDLCVGDLIFIGDLSRLGSPDYDDAESIVTLSEPRDGFSWYLEFENEGWNQPCDEDTQFTLLLEL